ncbi:MAG: N-acetyltransferase [Saprospiraceae bacterium]|nr:N-acetyltransferase [Saprospiraceae bacterium]
MNAKQKDDGKNGKFYIEVNGQLAAEMTYVWVGDSKIIIDHTDVSEILKGQGAGKVLVTQAVEFAREKGIKILPLCPFAKSVFDKTSEFRDVL